MASPQKENGYIKIANEIFDIFAKTRINGNERQVIDFIIRKTYGYHKKRDWISISQFERGTGLSSSKICKVIKKLKNMKIIIKIQDDNGNNIYEFNKNYEDWSIFNKGGVLEDSGGGLSCKTIGGLSCETDTKDIYTKDSIEMDKSISTHELSYEPIKSKNKTKGAFLDRARAKVGKPPMLHNNPEVWNIINKYRAQYKYITGKSCIVADADYFHVLSVSKKMSPQDMEQMVIWYVKMDNKKFKEHPSLKSIFTVENINKFNLQK